MKEKLEEGEKKRKKALLGRGEVRILIIKLNNKKTQLPLQFFFFLLI